MPHFKNDGIPPYFLELKGKRVNIQALINDRVSQAIEAAGEAAHENAKAFHDKCENSYPTVPSLG
ncbi:hypothetical protein WI665_17890 [Vibrio cholerae]